MLFHDIRCDLCELIFVHHCFFLSLFIEVKPKTTVLSPKFIWDFFNKKKPQLSLRFFLLNHSIN